MSGDEGQASRGAKGQGGDIRLNMGGTMCVLDPTPDHSYYPLNLSPSTCPFHFNNKGSPVNPF